MDLELAPLLAELDSAAYVLDALPNMSTETVVDNNAVTFISFLRKQNLSPP